MKVTRRGHHATRNTRGSHCLRLADAGEVGTLEDAGEILELRVHMIFRVDRMQVIKESNGSKSIKYHTALDAFVSRFLNTAENRSYTVV